MVEQTWRKEAQTSKKISNSFIFIIHGKIVVPFCLNKTRHEGL
jgi:hypothetical protein